MSYPILYKSTETEFDSNGVGVLSDAISCIVTEERNGSFEMKMQYPADGIHFGEIGDRSLILAKPNPIDDPQPFRVYRSTKPLKGIVTFYARHISYDLVGIPTGPFSASTVIEALDKLKSTAVNDCPFEFWTDKATSAKMTVTVPSDIRSLLGGQSGSVLDVYGGEYKFDRFTVRLYNQRGTDRGVTIRYGKNLIDLQQERNCASVYTGVYPYWVDSEGGNLVQLPEKIVNAPGNYDFSHILMLDLSTEWQETPTEEQLRGKAESYVKANDIGIPKVSLTVTHAMLEQAEEYKGQSLLERIDLCDTASVEFQKLGISASSKAIKTEFNNILDRYEAITFGDAKSNYIDTADEQYADIEKSKSETQSFVSDAMKKLNDLVQNASGLYTTEEVQTDGSTIYYYHDKPTLIESKNVIKFTADAIGLSTDGGKTYPFGFAVTGDMVTRLLETVGINANWINAGILQSLPDENGERAFFLDLVNGILRMKATELSIGGKSFVEAVSDEVKSGVDKYLGEGFTELVDEIRQQADQMAETWMQAEDPSLGWSEEEKQKHKRDFWYNTTDERTYLYDGEKWVDVTGTVPEGLFDAIDGKAKIFVTQPYTPYHVGDLWFAGPDADIMTCVTARESGDFVASDWEKRNKYVDKAAAEELAQSAVDAQTQQDIFNKLTNNGEDQGIFLQTGPDGKARLYLNGEYLKSGQVDADLVFAGDISITGNITWEARNSPSQVVYARVGTLSRPPDGTVYTSFPSASATYWHRTFDAANDKFASYTYDGGRTWSPAVKVVASDGKDGESALTMQIVSSNGNLFKNGEISTTLSALVYEGSVEVTDRYDPNQFIWTRVSANAEEDEAWNSAHAGGTKQIDITISDVTVRATFFCDLIDTTTRTSLL